MRQPELGFLMLSSHLGKPSRDILTVSQLRSLALAMKQADFRDADRDLREDDLIRGGFDMLMAQRIVKLLDDTELLEAYLFQADRYDCHPLTWAGANYPGILRNRLGEEAPGCIWARGDVSVLEGKLLSLVGSRDLHGPNFRFARAFGAQAARQGFVLVSGDARGADRTAQDAALSAGGMVVSVIADDLRAHEASMRHLYLSEDDFDAPFRSSRALSRNRLIHALPRAVFVAQSSLHIGGTWSGTYRNLRKRYSDVFVFDDGSAAAAELCDLGAKPCTVDDLQDLNFLLSSGHCL